MKKVNSKIYDGIGASVTDAGVIQVWKSNPPGYTFLTNIQPEDALGFVQAIQEILPEACEKRSNVLQCRIEQKKLEFKRSVDTLKDKLNQLGVTS